VYVLIINVVSCPPGAMIWKIKYLVSCIYHMYLLVVQLCVLCKYSSQFKRKNDVGTVHTVHGWWYQWSRRFLPFPITCHLVSPPSLSQFVLCTFLFILVSYNFMSFPSSFSSNSDRFFTWKKNLNLRFLCSGLTQLGTQCSFLTYLGTLCKCPDTFRHFMLS
jgi:hypothetical protein